MTIIRVNQTDVYDIFIGRPSKFGNPFRIGADGTRIEVIAKFKQYATNHPRLDDLLDELNHKRVACWCRIDMSCHGDVYVELETRRRRIFQVLDSFEY
jgi:hypothetical protein